MGQADLRFWAADFFLFSASLVLLGFAKQYSGKYFLSRLRLFSRRFDFFLFPAFPEMRMS